MKKGKKKWMREIAACIVLVLGILLLLFSGFYMVRTMWDYQEGIKEYDELKQKVFADEESRKKPEESSPTTETADGEQEIDQSIWNPLTSVCSAIAQMQEENDDVIGWIEFENLDISYPIVQGVDNNQYLRHTLSGEYNTAGCIFMESYNHSDFQDSHTIIYGHNMRNETMFGKLKNYKQIENYYQDHQYFTIYTKDKIYRYQIFAYYDLSETGFVYNVHFEEVEEFQKFIDTMYESSYEDTGVVAGPYDKIITLSTCSESGKRFVLNAVRVETREV